MKNFIHLHNHTSYSLLDGFGTEKDYVSKAVELKHTHLAITDHGNVDVAIKFQKECKKNDIIPIFGCEFYIVPDIEDKKKGEKRSHLVAFAKNSIGWKNIQQMITISYLDGFFYRPRISPEILLKYSEGIIISSACSATFLRHEWGIKFMDDFLEKHNDDFYLEIMPHKFDEQYEVNSLCEDLAIKYNLKIIATNDCHYVNKSDAKNQEVLLAIQTNKTWNDPKRWKFTGKDFYFKSRAEMIMAFREQNSVDREVYMQALKNTCEIAEKCREFVEIKPMEINLPVPEFERKGDDFHNLSELCNYNLIDMFDDPKKNIKYQERLNMELKIIHDKNFERYFLIVYNLIKWCKKNDVMYGPGRGSASGSLVCYLLGITQVDPIEYGLMFERFISPDRNDLPDIDIDFEDIKRPLIKKYLEDTYGIDNVAGVSTFSYMRGKGALRDVSRVFSVPLTDVNKACNVIETKLKGDEGYNSTIKDAFANFEEGKKFKEKYKEVSKVAERIEGTARNRGRHASAIIISGDNLKNGGRCSIVFGKDKESIINWDKDDMEHLGLMKLDVLGLNMLSVLNKTKQLVKENHKKEIDFNKIKLDDKRCFREFTKGNSIGCFQLGSPGLRKFCQQLKIDSFQMLIHATSLYRPGTLRSGMAGIFIKRKNEGEEIPRQHPIIKNITKDTFGIILYQEQMMRLINELAGIEWSTVDKIRKIVAKSKGREAFNEYEDMFVKGCLKNNTLTETEAFNLWSTLETFGEYSFNYSHATTYSVITYWGMWCKLNYPTEYICALLTYGTSDDDKRDEYISEAYRLEVKVRPPKVGKSAAFDWRIIDGILYAPFIEIKGVGDKTAKGFQKLNGKKSFYDNEDEKSPVSKRFLNILEKINAYNDVDIDDEEAEKINQFIGISFVKNRLHKYKNMIKLLSKEIDFYKAKEMNSRVRKDVLLFGEIKDLNFITTKGKDKKPIVSANFKDDSGYFKFTFSEGFYLKNKEKIESCEDEIVIAEVGAPSKPDQFICTNMWFTNDLLTANLSELDPFLVEKRSFVDKNVLNCAECSLRGECNSPVLPSKGLYNIMIIGEAPGYEENRIGMGFVGESGVNLWRELNKFDLDRDRFHVTNVCKCYPSKTKTPTKKHINKCSKWLIDEIKNINPFIVLAFGNTNLKFFLDEDSGIMAKNATTEWNEEYGCWICWCIHPASVIYNPDNITLFEQGIENFAYTIFEIGF